MSAGPRENVSRIASTTRGFVVRSRQRGNLPTVLARSIKWGLLCAFRRPATVPFGSHGGKLRLPARFGEGGAAPFVFRESYEPEIGYVEGALRPGMVFVDGGANLGVYTVLASNAVGDEGRVLSFEPGGDSYERLNVNIAANAATNIRPRRAALSDSSGLAPLYHTGGHAVSYSLAPDSADETSSEQVETVTIDEVLAEEGLDRLDFVKLDVEGSEELALRGAADSLARFQPIVMFESLSDAAISSELSRDGAWNYLAGLGYEFFTVDPDGGLVPATEPTEGNNIAMPRSAA
jgi:FkbM family methyltransferase